MCLLTKQIKPKVANDDIVCYKVVGYNKAFDNWYTPIRIFDIKKSIITGKKLLEAVGIGKKIGCLFEKDTFAIEDGYIHTYKDIKDALNEANKYETYLQTNSGSHFAEKICWYEVYKCIIPKSVEYYEGIVSEKKDGYASKYIKFVEKIK